MAENKVFVIHFEGERLAGTRAAYLTKGTAKAEVTRRLHHHVYYGLRISKYYEREKYDIAYAEEQKKFEVVEYIPKKE